jgi:glycine hydroxymethyltransferase
VLLSIKELKGYRVIRWYLGSNFEDVIESYAITKVTSLFSYDFANVQPYLGSLANVAVYIAWHIKLAIDHFRHEYLAL